MILSLMYPVNCTAGVVFSSASEAASRWGVDDVVDAFAVRGACGVRGLRDGVSSQPELRCGQVHGACGVWGLLAVGLFDRGARRFTACSSRSGEIRRDGTRD